ncbi:MAG: YihY/virulence factor BrkB family protein [Chitinophagaceae bacterium]|nr:YihY/virulence factor BrkB family protein [Chitinophagaceae bacterium]
MKKRLTGWWRITRQTFIDFADVGVPRMSAALSYYTLFSLAPILLIVITVGDVFYGREAIEGTLFGQIQSFIGADAAHQVQEIIRNAASSNNTRFASVVSIIALVFSATGVFTEIQSSINAIWQLKAKPQKGWLKFLFNRMLSLSMVLGLGFILLVSLFVNTMLEILLKRLLTILPGDSVWLTYSVNMLITFIVISFLFGVIFKLLPDAKIHWKDVRRGAFVTAILFMLARFGISYYLGKSNPGGAYGTAGSVVIILLWVYFSAMILYLGACFTKVYAQHSGREIFPNQYAVFVKHIEVENKEGLQEQPETIVVVKKDEAI